MSSVTAKMKKVAIGFHRPRQRMTSCLLPGSTTLPNRGCASTYHSDEEHAERNRGDKSNRWSLGTDDRDPRQSDEKGLDAFCGAEVEARVDRLQVHREPVQDSPTRRRVEKGHRTVQNMAEHRKVNVSG